MAVSWDSWLCETAGTTSLAFVSGIVSPFLLVPVDAALHSRFSWMQSCPRTLSKLWFSCRITTTCSIGVGKELGASAPPREPLSA